MRNGGHDYPRLGNVTSVGPAARLVPGMAAASTYRRLTIIWNRDTVRVLSHPLIFSTVIPRYTLTNPLIFYYDITVTGQV